MSVAKSGGVATLEIVGCKVVTHHASTFFSAEISKHAKVYVYVRHVNTADSLRLVTEEKPLFEIDGSFSYSWVTYNEIVSNVPKDSKLLFDFRLLAPISEKEMKFGSFVVSVTALTEEVVYFDFTEVETRGNIGSIGLRLLPSMKRDHMYGPEVGLKQWKLDHSVPYGRLTTVVWKGRRIASTYPVYLIIGLTARGSCKHKTTVQNIPTDPVFDHIAEMDVFSMQGDLVLSLWEVHNVRSHKLLGQIIFPLSWLANMSTQSKDGRTACISGWFQFLPPNKVSAYNNGGQYRPYVAGTPKSTGFGLDEPENEKVIGYLRVQVMVELVRPIFRSLFLQPALYCHETVDMELMDDDSVMTIVSTMMVAKNNLMQIYYRFRYPMWLNTLIDIIRWREHPVFTCVALYFWTYAVLVAPPWQFPIIFGLFFFFVGYVTSRRRNFNNINLYIPEMDIDTSEESSLRDKYQKLKSAAYTVASLVESVRITIDRMGNIFTWADPLVTAATYTILLSVCGAFSIFLFVFPPHAFIFCAGLMAFVPEEFLDHLIQLSKEYEKKAKKILKNVKREWPSKVDSWLKVITGNRQELPAKKDLVVETMHVSSPASAGVAGVTVKAPSSPAPGKGNIFLHGSKATSRRRASIAFGKIETDDNHGSNVGALRVLPSDLAPAGHVRSTFLLSQHWEKGSRDASNTISTISPEKVSDQQHQGDIILAPAPSSLKQWSSRWCELWKAPPVLSMVSGSEKQKIYIDLNDATAAYM